MEVSLNEVCVILRNDDRGDLDQDRDVELSRKAGKAVAIEKSPYLIAVCSNVD
jgi:hypothetical protein